MKSVFEFFVSRLRSVGHACDGLRDILTTEHNAWIHAVFTVIVIPLALLLRIDFREFALIVIVIVLVWVAEAFNTVLEVVVDMVSPRYSKAAKRAKDIAAGAVLMASLGAVVVGGALLGPPLYIQLSLLFS